jgi:hypothetical protein
MSKMYLIFAKELQSVKENNKPLFDMSDSQKAN